MNLNDLPKQPGVRLGALIDAVVFAIMMVGWYAHGWWTSTTARNADSGAMDLLLLLVVPLTLLFCLALTLGSSLLGAVAGLAAAQTRSPWIGALVGLANSLLAATVLTLPAALQSDDAGLLSLWMNKLQWLTPPALLAGGITGWLARRRPI